MLLDGYWIVITYFFSIEKCRLFETTKKLFFLCLLFPYNSLVATVAYKYKVGKYKLSSLNMYFLENSWSPQLQMLIVKPL